MILQIGSEAFSDGEKIAGKYTDDGQNVSPPLHISGTADCTANR